MNSTPSQFPSTLNRTHDPAAPAGVLGDQMSIASRQSTWTER